MFELVDTVRSYAVPDTGSNPTDLGVLKSTP